ncbi:hypothetical protein, partial [Lysinibacillus mangiferihumi]
MARKKERAEGRRRGKTLKILQQERVFKEEPTEVEEKEKEKKKKKSKLGKFFTKARKTYNKITKSNVAKKVKNGAKAAVLAFKNTYQKAKQKTKEVYNQAKQKTKEVYSQAKQKTKEVYSQAK